MTSKQNTPHTNTYRSMSSMDMLTRARACWEAGMGPPSMVTGSDAARSHRHPQGKVIPPSVWHLCCGGNKHEARARSKPCIPPEHGEGGLPLRGDAWGPAEVLRQGERRPVRGSCRATPMAVCFRGGRVGVCRGAVLGEAGVSAWMSRRAGGGWWGLFLRNLLGVCKFLRTGVLGSWSESSQVGGAAAAPDT